MHGVAVHLTRIYTRAGDDGTTALGDMSRVDKTDPRVGAYAAVDETNAAIGVALALGDLPPRVAEVLRVVQNDLFDVGADLCTPVVPDPGVPAAARRGRLRRAARGLVRRVQRRAAQAVSFILPGGTPGAALLHSARTLTRRAERAAWELLEADPDRTSQRRDALPQPAQGPAVHPVPGREPRRRRAVEAGRRALSASVSGPVVVVVMGVSGCGKSTIGHALAERLGCEFCEGDDLHPAANVEAMAAGHPLDDAMRAPWLAAIAAWVDKTLGAGGTGVVSCSALKRRYRDRLRRPQVLFAHVDAPKQVFADRLAHRHGHFMPPTLLDSQLADLEPPGPDERAVRVDATLPVEHQVDAIVATLSVA